MSLRLCKNSLEEIKQSGYFLPLLKNIWVEHGYTDEVFEEWLEALNKEEVEEMLDILIVEEGV